MELAQWIFESETKKTRGTFKFGKNAVLRAGGNTGLWFDKFVEYKATKKKLEQGDDSFDLRAHSTEWARSVADQVGDKSELDAHVERLCRLVKRMNGDCRSFQVPPWGQFVTGVGIEHPIENGFAWHHTLGMPYLPGSGVKGMTLAWARDWLKCCDGQRDTMFGRGANGDGDTGSIGNVVFFDAIPIDPPTLSVEVLTPHGGGSGAPEDAGKTNPIGFLAVKEATFLFAVIPVSTKDNYELTSGGGGLVSKKDAEKACTNALGFIGEALAKIGAGAKTKSGYGRFIGTGYTLSSSVTTS